MLFILLSSCSFYQTDQRLHATVQDPWGHKILDATVAVPEYSIKKHTNSGTIKLSEQRLFSNGYNEILVEASAPGFIQAQKIFEHGYGSPFGTSITLELFPKLKTAGVYAVGQKNYTSLTSVPILSFSSDLEHIDGFHHSQSVPLLQPMLISHIKNLLKISLYELTPVTLQKHKEKHRLSSFKLELLIKNKELNFQSLPLEQPNVVMHTLTELKEHHFYLFETQLRNGLTKSHLFHKIKRRQ